MDDSNYDTIAKMIEKLVPNTSIFELSKRELTVDEDYTFSINIDRSLMKKCFNTIEERNLLPEYIYEIAVFGTNTDKALEMLNYQLTTYPCCIFKIDCF